MLAGWSTPVCGCVLHDFSQCVMVHDRERNHPSSLNRLCAHRTFRIVTVRARGWRGVRTTKVVPRFELLVRTLLTFLIRVETGSTFLSLCVREVTANASAYNQVMEMHA